MYNVVILFIKEVKRMVFGYTMEQLRQPEVIAIFRNCALKIKIVNVWTSRRGDSSLEDILSDEEKAATLMNGVATLLFEAFKTDFKDWGIDDYTFKKYLRYAVVALGNDSSCKNLRVVWSEIYECYSLLAHLERVTLENGSIHSFDYPVIPSKGHYLCNSKPIYHRRF
jgi:hypothetical protein